MYTTGVPPAIDRRAAGWFGTVVSWAALSCLVAGVSLGQETEPVQASPEADVSPPDVPGRANRRLSTAMRTNRDDPGQLVANSWWNQEAMIEALALSAEQRKAMDTVLTEFLGGRSARSEARQAATRRYYQALDEGDVEEARQQIGALGDASGELVRATAEMRVAILEVLSEQQLATLRSERPGLVRGRWIGGQAGARRTGSAQDAPARGTRPVRRPWAQPTPGPTAPVPP